MGPWNIGDVFAGVSNGKYNVYDNAGNFKQTIDQGGPFFTTGCSFNNTLDKLYTTNFSASRIIVFRDAQPHAILQDITDGDINPESISFDQAGNFFTGHANGNQDILRHDPTGAVTGTFNPVVGPSGSDRIDLSSDQHTIFYTSEGPLIRRFNVATNTQLPDFANIPDQLFALRLLPPGDGSGGLIVAGFGGVRRLNASGAVVQTYNFPGITQWYTVSLDPDGISFWAGDIASGQIFKFNIATGAVSTIITTGAPGNLFGVCLKGELTAAVATDRTPPSCTLANRGVDGSGHVFIQIAARDEQTGLQSVVVTAANNADVPVPPFTIGSTSTLMITATKIDQTRSSQIEIRVTDGAGNVTVCDPVDATLGSGTRWGNLKILSGIPQAEGKLSITNATTGLTSLVVIVNGKRFEATRLHTGELRSLDISSAMNAGDRNTVVLRAIGPSGASAGILIWDGRSDPQFAARAGYSGTVSGSN
ncbi:MAG: SMP-30/gluconolactonase/LRE family protein [Gemmatimonadota bacterium]|nr:SMP-30/gluconolactonase/LRE family protein [Gemmatimonadota bacterium]